MKDSDGNFNEIVPITYLTESDNAMTIEEAIEYQKTHEDKIFSLWEYDPEEVVEYIKNSGAKYII